MFSLSILDGGNNVFVQECMSNLTVTLQMNQPYLFDLSLQLRKKNCSGTLSHYYWPALWKSAPATICFQFNYADFWMNANNFCISALAYRVVVASPRTSASLDASEWLSAGGRL